MNNCCYTLYDVMARNAGLFPDRDALVYDGRRTTFRDYKERCDRYAAGLTGAGTAAGDRIALLAGNSDDFLILCGAAAKIGAVVVPVNWRLGEEEMEYVLADTTPKLIVSGKGYGETARRLAAKTASVTGRYTFAADEAGSGAIPFGTLRREGEAAAPDAGSAAGDPDYMIIHTAAVGGRPRGCLLSQGNIVACALQIARLLQLGSADCHLGILPLFHIGGLAMTWATMLGGGKNVVVDRFDPPAVLGLMEAERGTFFTAFPPILASLLDAQEQGSFDASSLRMVCGMDSPETLARFFRVNPRAAFFSLYGQTEAMPVSGCNYGEKPGSIGPPALLTRVAIFDDLGGEAAPGATGEICVRSPAVFRGYWGRPEDTARTSRQGWHHTGDLGRCDEEGYLWYAGRKPEKELIKPGGENVYPAEVEQVILGHGAVAEVCVIGVPDPEWGEAVKAVCVLGPGMALSAGELSDFVAAKIARYKKPKHVVFVAALPKTAAGAVNREEVKRLYSGTD